MFLTWNHWQTWFRLVPPAPCRRSYGPSTRIAYAFCTRDEYLGNWSGKRRKKKKKKNLFKFGIFEVKIGQKPDWVILVPPAPCHKSYGPSDRIAYAFRTGDEYLENWSEKQQRRSLSLGTLKPKFDTNPSDLVMVFLVSPSSFIHSLLVSCVFPSTEWPHFHLPASLHPRAVVGSVCWGRGGGGGGYNTCLSHPHPCLMIFVVRHVEAFPGLVWTGSFRYLPVKPSPYTVGEVTHEFIWKFA